MKPTDLLTPKVTWTAIAAITALLSIPSPAARADAIADAANVDTKDIAPPEVGKVAPDFWHQQYMLGDWGGERTALAKEGVTFDFNDIGDMLTDVTGSQDHHVTYFGRFRASADIDFNKLSDFDGEFFFSAIYQYGRNLSGDYLHVNTLTSSIAGEESLRIDQMWYQAGLLDHKIHIKFGQIAPINEFGATDFFDILFNDELGYAPNAIFNTRVPFSPAGKPGVIIQGDLGDITPGLYAKAGVFTAYDNPYRPDSNGVYYENDFDHGMSMAAEVGYEEQHTDYAGIYRLGATGTPDVVYFNPATGQKYNGDYNIYATMEKTVYHPRLDTTTTDPKDMKSTTSSGLDHNKGLDLLLELVGAPGDRNSLQYEVTAGARYSGPFSCRPNDKVGVGFIYSDNSNASSLAYSAANGGRTLGGEETFELDYQYNPSPWLTIQPDIQYIVNPGGDFQRQDIAVLGLRTIVKF